MPVPPHPPPDWSPLHQRVLTHWETFRPTLARQLRQEGSLQQTIHQAVVRAMEQEQALVAQGADREQAWELVQQDLFPPAEAARPPQGSVPGVPAAAAKPASTTGLPGLRS